MNLISELIILLNDFDIELICSKHEKHYYYYGCGRCSLAKNINKSKFMNCEELVQDIKRKHSQSTEKKCQEEKPKK